MTPPFKLEQPERLKGRERRFRILPTKNTYSEGVKVRDWERYRESKPIDNDPYCPGSLNYFLSHYDRLGTNDANNYRTTTGDMLEQIFIKDTVMHQDKFLMSNYYTIADNEGCLEDLGCRPCCKKISADDYLTTMQHSYRPPYPITMQRIGFPIIPFLRNRKFKNEEPEVSPEKFYDESFYSTSDLLRKTKGDRWVSYNPGTGEYTGKKANC